MLTNTTNYNKDTIHEAVKKIARPMQMYYIVLIIISILLAVGFSIYNFSSIGMYVCIVAVVFVVMGIYEIINQPKRFEKTMMERIRTTHHKDSYDVKYTINKTSILGDNEISTTDYKNTDIKKIEETDNIFVITYAGKTFGIIDKNGFTEGTAQDFREMFKDDIK